MKPSDAITPATITFVVTIIGSWIWATTYFMVRADADETHAAFSTDIRTQYLELKIDQYNTELVFIEQDGISDVERRRFDLLKFGVERMSQQLYEGNQ